ncbi:MAG: N-acetylglucosamine-6-phosphate deacetylase [Eubacterium sp.]|nr:N-acetylglucosamine-6-phosphate deacetylase [Eubacterium sp.]
MIIKNANIYTTGKVFQKGEIRIQDGKFSSQTTEQKVIDAKGCYAIPGLIDMHLHGCAGYDLCDGTLEALAKIAEHQANAGITGICPATMTLPKQELVRILRIAAEYKKQCETHSGMPDPVLAGCGKGADLLGINMEGPFISSEKKGAQDPKHIVPCSMETAQEFIEASGGLVKLIGVAPENNPDFRSFITQLKGQVHISLAHTNADYDTAMAAFDAGADHAVHLYNAMPPFTHRQPGVIGAVCDSPHVHAELICDGIHIHPSVVRATFRMLGADRIVLISDSMRAAGMPDGSYTLGGLNVNVKNKKATLASDGAIAGSASNLMECMRTAVTHMGIPLEQAVACATVNPAKRLGVYKERGSIEVGKKADLVLLDDSLDVQLIIKDGKVLQSL